MALSSRGEVGPYIQQWSCHQVAEPCLDSAGTGPQRIQTGEVAAARETGGALAGKPWYPCCRPLSTAGVGLSLRASQAVHGPSQAGAGLRP